MMRLTPPRLGASRLIALIVLLVASAGAVAYGIVRASTSGLEQYEIETIQTGTIEQTITALGKLQPANYVDVGAQVSGQLTRILVQPGDQVEAGDLLAEIDPQLQAAKVDADRAELARLMADLEAAQAEATFAAGEFERQTQLRRENATRDDVYAQARRDKLVSTAKVASLRAQIDQAQSTLKADEAQLSYTRIYAPMAGTVISVDARQGQTINANYSAPVLLRIADLGTMTVRTEVSEADVTRLRENMPLYFTTLGHGDRRWSGTLRQILPAPPKATTTNSGSGQSAAPTPSGAGNVVLYTALFDVANPKGELRPDMTAQVFFVRSSATNTPLVPMMALSTVDAAAGLYSVQTVVAGRIERREVKIGIHDRVMAEVVSGLRAGDRVTVGQKAGDERPSLLGFRL